MKSIAGTRRWARSSARASRAAGSSRARSPCRRSPSPSVPLALLSAPNEARARPAPRPSPFAEVEAGIDATHHVAEGYDADVLLRWGDALFADLARLRSDRNRRRPRRRASSATTMTTSALSRSMARPSTASSSSTTNTPTRISCSRAS